MIREALDFILNEASIFLDKYTVGHEILLKTKGQGDFFEKYPIGSIFSKENGPTYDAEYTISSKGELIDIFLKDEKGTNIKLTATKTRIKSIFNHHGNSSKGDTAKKTEVKELISLFVLMNGAGTTEEEALKYLYKEVDEYSYNLYKSLFFRSAIKQFHSLSLFGIDVTSGYYGERQRGDATENLYSISKKLTGMHADNWNPADVWFIKNNFRSKYNKFIKQFDTKTSNVTVFNDWVSSNMKEGNIYPISLKQIEDNREAKTETISSDNGFPDYDYSLESVDIKVTGYRNFIAWTNGGFGVRVGAKSGSVGGVKVYSEGKMKGKSNSIGAVSKSALKTRIEKQVGKYTRESDKRDDKAFYKILKISNKSIGKFFNMGGKHITEKQMIEAYDALETDEEKAFALNLMTWCYGMISEGPKKVDGWWKWMHMTAKKLSDESCPYIIIH